MTSPDRTVPDEAATPDAVVTGPAGSGATASEAPEADTPGPAVASASPLPLTGELVPPGEPGGANDELSGTIAALTADDLDQSERRKLLGRLAGQIRLRAIGDLFRPRAAIRWIADTVSDVAPRLPIRDRETLLRHFPGLSDEAIAERLIRNAALTTAAVGAASGGVAAIEWVATPTLLSAPILLAAETVAVVAIEIKLIGELHEVFGAPVSGTRSQRAVALVQAWAHRRGIDPQVPGGIGLAAVLGTAARKELRDRLLRRFGRNLTTYGPMLTGAAVASYLNRRATIALGQQIRKDLERGVGRAAITRAPTQPPTRD
jgi:uncharacterized protein (DUF697 family)